MTPSNPPEATSPLSRRRPRPAPGWHVSPPRPRSGRRKGPATAPRRRCSPAAPAGRRGAGPTRWCGVPGRRQRIRRHRHRGPSGGRNSPRPRRGPRFIDRPRGGQDDAAVRLVRQDRPGRPPHPQHPVVAPGKQPQAVRRERDAADRLGVADERPQAAAGRRVPELHRAVGARRGDEGVVGRKRDGVDGASMRPEGPRCADRGAPGDDDGGPGDPEAAPTRCRRGQPPPDRRRRRCDIGDSPRSRCARRTESRPVLRRCSIDRVLRRLPARRPIARRGLDELRAVGELQVHSHPPPQFGAGPDPVRATPSRVRPRPGRRTTAGAGWRPPPGSRSARTRSPDCPRSRLAPLRPSAGPRRPGSPTRGRSGAWRHPRNRPGTRAQAWGRRRSEHGSIRPELPSLEARRRR